MSKNKIFFAVFPLVLFLVGCGNIKPDELKKSQPSLLQGFSVSSVKPEIKGESSSLPVSREFIDPRQFKSTDQLRAFDYKDKPRVGVVNHHVLAGDLMAKFFKTLKTVRPEIETFIILSPDHFSRGRGVSTHGLTYVTPAGDVVVRKRWVFEFGKTGVWDGTESRAFENEHGVGALVPFIAREFPGAKILPIFLRADLKTETAKQFGEDLARLADDETFVVVSSDMSHYLKELEARRHDAETIRWLQQNQWDKLSSATDDNTDSAVAFKVLQSYFNSKKIAYNFNLLSHKLSTDYGAELNSTTSYIVGFWK